MNNFEYWAKLAQNNPQAFEQQRQQVIKAHIAAAPLECQHRLKQLQFQIEMIRTQATTPYASALSVSNLMRDKFAELQQTLTHYQELLEGRQHKARVISFEDARKRLKK